MLKNQKLNLGLQLGKLMNVFWYKSNFLLQLAVCLLDCIMAEFSQMILHGREVCTLQTSLYILEYSCYLFSARQLPFCFKTNRSHVCFTMNDILVSIISFYV